MQRYTFRVGLVMGILGLFAIWGCTKGPSLSETVVDILVRSPQPVDPFQIRASVPDITRVDLEIQGEGMNQAFHQAVQLLSSTERKIRTVLPLGPKSITAKGFGSNNKLLASDSQEMILRGGQEYTLILTLKELKDQKQAVPALSGALSGTTAGPRQPQAVQKNQLPSTNAPLKLPTDTTLLDKAPTATNSNSTSGGTITPAPPSSNTTNPAGPQTTTVAFVGTPQPTALPLLLSLPPAPGPTPTPSPGITNNAPVLTHISALNPQGTHLVISGFGFDPSPGNNLVRFGGLVAMVNMASTSSLDVTVGLSSGTTYPVTVAVEGRVSNIINLTFPVPTVITNQPPVIQSIVADPGSVSGLGFPTEVTVNATDIDSTLTGGAYVWSCDGGCGTFNPTTGAKVVWTAPTASGGLFTLRVSVSDGVNLPVQGTLPIYVNTGIASININAR